MTKAKAIFLYKIFEVVSGKKKVLTGIFFEVTVVVCSHRFFIDVETFFFLLDNTARLYI